MDGWGHDLPVPSRPPRFFGSPQRSRTALPFSPGPRDQAQSAEPFPGGQRERRVRTGGRLVAEFESGRDDGKVCAFDSIARCAARSKALEMRVRFTLHPRCPRPTMISSPPHTVPR